MSIASKDSLENKEPRGRSYRDINRSNNTGSPKFRRHIEVCYIKSETRNYEYKNVGQRILEENTYPSSTPVTPLRLLNRRYFRILRSKPDLLFSDEILVHQITI